MYIFNMINEFDSKLDAVNVLNKGMQLLCCRDIKAFNVSMMIAM